jgi:hypothetical protein
MSSATMVVVANSAVLSPVTAQTVGSERGVGGRISRRRALAGQGQRQSTACALRSHRDRLRSGSWFCLICSLLDLRTFEPSR